MNLFAKALTGNLTEKDVNAPNGAFSRKVDELVGFHKHCNDCGRFLNKKRWVPKDHKWKKHALCDECAQNYETDELY